MLKMLALSYCNFATLVDLRTIMINSVDAAEFFVARRMRDKLA